MGKESHQLFGKAILVLSALLFSVVLITTLLTLLSYGENSFEPNQPNANESTDIPALHSTAGFRRPLLSEKEYNLVKEDKNLNDFLASLNSLLIQESRPNVDHGGRVEFNSSDSPASSTQSPKGEHSEVLNLNLKPDWKKNSLNVGDALALRQVQPESDYEMVRHVPYERTYEAVDSKSYRLPKRQSEDSEYNDVGYYDQYLNNGKEENTIEIYDNQSSDQQDGGQVQYYLIRKEHNQVNLASQHEIRGLNELINRALSKQDHIKYPPVHVRSPTQQPNVFVFPSSGQPATIIQPSNIVQQPSQHPIRDHHHYFPYGENFWGWSWPGRPFKKLTMKQRVKINLCDRMMRNVSPYPLRMLLPFYR